jgi:hypothetical protein
MLSSKHRFILFTERGTLQSHLNPGEGLTVAGMKPNRKGCGAFPLIRLGGGRQPHSLNNHPKGWDNIMTKTYPAARAKIGHVRPQAGTRRAFCLKKSVRNTEFIRITRI